MVVISIAAMLISMSTILCVGTVLNLGYYVLALRYRGSVAPETLDTLVANATWIGPMVSVIAHSIAAVYIHRRFPPWRLWATYCLIGLTLTIIHTGYWYFGYGHVFRSVQWIALGIMFIAIPVAAKAIATQWPHPTSPLAVTHLSPREQEIVTHIDLGKTAKDIASQLFITESTAKNHIYNIYKKLGVSNRIQLLNAIRAQKDQ